MMTWTMKWLLIAALITTAGTAAIAQPSPETLYTEGQTAYEHGDYATAITKWQAAYDLSKENGLLFNLAQAERLGGDCASALTNYRNFLARDSDPTSDQHKLASDFAQELSSQCSEAPAPSTAKSAPLAPPKVVEISLPDNREEREMPASNGRRWKMTGLVTGGVGVATLAIGLGLGHHGSEIGTEVTAACRTSCDWSMLKDKDTGGRREVAIGRVLDVVGAAAIAGGAVFYYIGVRQESVTITPRDGGAVVSLRGSW